MTSAAESSDSPTPLMPLINEAAAKISFNYQKAASMSAGSGIVSPTGDAATTTAPRLLDNDPSKFRSLKRVIVIGRPGSGTDGVGDALKKLGFKVYDFQAASTRYERDFPLWLEAARLRKVGRPYNKSDFDKLIGDHDALVGAPCSFFDAELVKLYPGVKVILMTRDGNPDFMQKHLKRAKSPLWRWADPIYFGNLARFVSLIKPATNDASYCSNSDGAIRKTVRERNLLEIKDFIAWVPLCDFLDAKVPDAPAPALHDKATEAELSTRPQRWALENAKKVSHFTVMSLTYLLTMGSVTLISTLAVFLGCLGLFKVALLGAQLLTALLVYSQICDVTRLLAAGMALCTLVCGLVAGYSLAIMRVSKALKVESPVRYNDQRKKNGYRPHKQGRGKQAESREKMRPARPTLAEWNGVQENIRRDDAEMREQGQATQEQWRNGRHVTFHVTHKRTEAGQDLFSGQRKVLAVTEETM